MMLQVSSHEDFQNSVFDKSFYAQIKYQAIPSNKLTVDMLKNTLRAFGGDPVQIFPKETSEKLFLLNEIEAAVNKNRWKNDRSFFVIVGLGQGQLIQGMQQADPGNLEEQEEKARILIAKYPKLLCVIDTDITSIVPLGDSGLEPSDMQNLVTEPERGRLTNELEVLTETVKNLKQELAHVKDVNQVQTEQIRQHGIMYDQALVEYKTLERQITAENRNSEDRTFNDELHEREIEEDHDDLDLELRPQETEDAMTELSSEYQKRHSNHSHRPSIGTEDLLASYDSAHRIEKPPTPVPKHGFEDETMLPSRRNVTYDIPKKEVYRPPSLRTYQPENLQLPGKEEHHMLQKELHLARKTLSRTQELLELSQNRNEKLREYLVSSEDEPIRWKKNTTSVIRTRGLQGKSHALPKPNMPDAVREDEDSLIFTSSDGEVSPVVHQTHKINTLTPLSKRRSRSRYDDSCIRPRSYKAWTLKMLNIQKYDPERMDIITHVERVTRILEEVEVTPESQKIRLLVASFPTSMDYYEQAVSNESRKNYRKFSQELVKIMGSKVRVASQRFMQCHRKRGEDILRFFFRLCDLYKSSKGLMGDEWHLNPTHVSHIYSLLYHGLYNEEQLRLDEKLDKQLERGILTVARLKKELIEINKMASNKVRGEIPTSKAIMTVEAIKNKEQEDDYEETHALSSGESAEDESTYWEN